MNNRISPKVKQVWNVSMHVMRICWGLSSTQEINTRLNYSLHLLLLKCSMARQSRKIGKRIKKLIFCKTFHRWRFNLPRFDRRIVFPWPERSWICRIFAVGVFGNVDVVGYDVQSRLHDARHDVGRPREEERRFSRRKSRRRQWWSGWVTLPT